MSFINNREKLFKSKSSTHPAKKVTTGRMKSASSFTDPRAWSLDARERSSFIMDAMAEMASSSGGEDNGNDSMQKVIMEEQKLSEIGRRRSKVLPADSVDDDHDLIKLSNKLFEAKEKIDELQTVNNNLLDEKSKTTAEVDNLRVLVTNLREQMAYLESLGTSSEICRSEDELKTARALEDAQLEIEHLSKEIEIYSGMCQWHSDLREVQERLNKEKKELSKTVSELNAEKKRLSEELKKREDDVAALEIQLQASSQASLEKSVLRERLAAKDEKIQELNSVVEKQALTVEELKETVSIMTERFLMKEDSLNQEMKHLTATLDEKNARISQLETKLHETELLVAELEALRDQFRTTNIALGESVAAYKKDIEKAMNVSDELAETIRKLRSENKAKDREIEKLTLFPQNPDTMLYFSQLNKLVTSTGNFDELDADDQVDLLETIKNVIIKLKTEMWGSNVTPVELQIQDSCVQAEPERSDNEIQCYPVMSSVELQTSLPDEYLVKVHNREEDVLRLNSKILNCEHKLNEQAAEFDSLENSLFDVIEENYSKDLLIENARRNQELLEDTLEVFNKDLNNKDKLLANALAEIHEQSENCKTLREVLETTLQTTVVEFSEYVGVLEAFLEFKETQILNVQESAKENKLVQDETIEQIACENEALKSELRTEKSANVELSNQVICLMKSLKERIVRSKELEEKLERAERTIRKIVDNGGTLSQNDGSSGDYEQVTNLCSQLAAYKSDLCKQLEENHALEDEIKRLKSSKRSMRTVLIKTGAQKKKSDMKILRMAMHLRKISKRGVKLKDELSKGELEKVEIVRSLGELRAEKDVLNRERSVLLQELYAMKNRLSETETSLEKYKAKEISHEELKMKMERMVLKLMKKVTKYKTEVNDRRDVEEKLKNHLVMNEQLYHEIDMLKNENLSLSTTICEFERKLSSLMELPEKESSSVELQVSLEESSGEETCGSIGMKSHYENVIATMKTDYDNAAEQSHRQYMNNLKMLKDTYERDIVNMKNAHSENLAKIKLMHAEELHHQSRKVDWESEKSRMERLHADEIADLREKYETLFRTKKAELLDEKNSLAEEVAEMKSEFAKVLKETTLEMESMKGKFKDQIKKLEELQGIERELLKRKFDQQIEREIEKRVNEKKPPTSEKKIQCYRVNCGESGTYPDCSVNTRDSCTNTDNNSDTSIVISCNVKEERTESFHSLEQGPSCSHEVAAFPERLFLLSRIGELEKSLQMQQVESTRKIKLYEKRLKHKQMKAKEIAYILDQELRYSTDVHCRLGMQYNRAEQLELEKQTLASRVLLYEQQLTLRKQGEGNFNHPAITYDDGLVDAERELEVSLNERIDTENETVKGPFAVSSEVGFQNWNASKKLTPLEQSAVRLKEKIDLAVEQEKRISSVGKKGNQSSGQSKSDGVTDRIPRRETNKTSEADGAGDMKVIVIQQHKVTHAWSSQIDNVYS